MCNRKYKFGYEKNIELIQSKIKLDMLKVKKDIISSDKLCDGI